LADYIKVKHRFELINGLYFYTDFSYAWRQNIPGHFTNAFENWFPQEDLEDFIEEPLQFEPYQSLVSDMRLSYTPAQKYLTEPDRKFQSII